MSVENALRKLEEEKKKKEVEYARIKGLILGVSAGRRLTATQKDILKVFEVSMNGLKTVWDDIIKAYEIILNSVQRINGLETRVSELENNILQLRKTLDKMVQDR